MPLKLEKYLTCSLMLHCLRAILFELVVLLDIILSWNLIYKIGLVSYLHYILYGRTEAYSEPPLMAAGEKGQIPLPPPDLRGSLLVLPKLLGLGKVLLVVGPRADDVDLALEQLDQVVRPRLDHAD